MSHTHRIVIGVCNPLIEEAAVYDEQLNIHGFKASKKFKDVFYVQIGWIGRDDTEMLNDDVVIDKIVCRKYTVVRVQWISFEVVFENIHDASVAPVSQTGGYFQYTVQDSSGRLKEMKEDDVIEEDTSTRELLEDKVEETSRRIDNLNMQLQHEIDHLDNINREPYYTNPDREAKKKEAQEKSMKRKQDLERFIDEETNILMKCQEMLRVLGNLDNTAAGFGVPLRPTSLTSKNIDLSTNPYML